MKTNPWTLLAKAARQSRRPPPSVVPFGFETRVLAGWRGVGRTPTLEDDLIRWRSLLRGGLICSSLIMLLTLVLSVTDRFWTASTDSRNEIEMAESVIQMTFSR